ncbi:MAG: hypothetical protein ABIH37_05640 [archaeon]
MINNKLSKNIARMGSVNFLNKKYQLKSNKKASINPTLETVIYTVLIVALAAITLFFIVRPSVGVTAHEQIFAKKIALEIDKTEPGMKIYMDIYDMYKIAKESKFKGKIVDINNDLNKVNVKLTKGDGYNFYYFSDVNVVWNIDTDKKELMLDIKNKKSDENVKEDKIEEVKNAA